MSIASELNALNGYILGAYDEINTKGGTVPANKNMANLASAIGSISGGGGGGADAKVLFGSQTFDSTYTLSPSSNYITIEHNFGQKPDFFMFYNPSATSVSNELIGGFYWNDHATGTSAGSSEAVILQINTYTNYQIRIYRTANKSSLLGLNDLNSCFIRGTNSSAIISAGHTLYWVVGTFQ